MTSTAYPPSHIQGRHPPQPPAPRHSSSSSPFGSTPALPSPSPIRTGTTNFKPMYDLPPTLVQHASSGSGGGGGGGRTAGGLAGRGGGGGITSPPPPLSFNNNNKQQHGSTPPPFSPTHSNGYGGTSPTTSRSFPSTSLLHHPQPTRPTPPLAPPSSSSSSSVFSKAPQNPSSPSPSDISLFHSACLRFFYHQDPSAHSYIESVLSSLPPSHRAAFTRVQAAVRSAFHADEEVRRKNEFEVLLRGTDPGGGLTVGNRRDPKGKGARREREERLKLFLRDYGGKNEVGPRPFLLAVWTALRLQGGKEEKGGAGGRRVEWEVDDATWMEAGGKDFMIEAIAVVKGVLGFEDIPRTKPRRQHHRHQQRPPNSSSNSRSFSTGASSYSIPNGGSSNGAGPSHRRPSDLEELRPTPEDDEAGPLYDSSSRYASPPLPTGQGGGGNSRRGKAPPIPSSSNSRHHQLPTATQQQAQQLSSSSSSSSNPLISSRRRASSDPFSDPYANMSSRQPPPVPPNTLNRRGPGTAPPPPTRPHPTFLNLNLDATNIPSPLGGGALGSRSMSNSSSNNGRGGFITPNNGQEDFLLPLPGRSPGGASASSSAGARSPSSAGPLLQQHSASAVDDEDLSSSDELSSPLSTTSDEEEEEEEDPLLPRWRTWIAPSNLSNPDLTRLCRLFPSHITKSTTSSSSSVRFPYAGPSNASASPKELEEGLGGASVVARGGEGKTVGRGVLEGVHGGWTGRMWKGERRREEGWRGGWWRRWVGWLGRVFGC